jgi:hypothetical protein
VLQNSAAAVGTFLLSLVLSLIPFFMKNLKLIMLLAGSLLAGSVLNVAAQARAEKFSVAKAHRGHHISQHALYKMKRKQLNHQDHFKPAKGIRSDAHTGKKRFLFA